MRKLLQFAPLMLLAHIVFGNEAAKNIPLGPELPPFFKLERHCEQEVRKGAVIGTALAVVKDQRVSFIQAFGKLKKSDAALVTTDTAFQLASTSKTITATLFALARKLGRISLDTPVNLPQCRYPLIQTRHVLSHTSGFKRTGFNWHIEHGANRGKLLALFNKKEQEQPGSVFDYHNVAFSLIEDNLHKAFSLPFDSAVREHVFKPLNMGHSSVGFTKFKEQANRAWPHERNKQGKFVEAQEYSFRYHETVPSAAGMNASIKDMAQFLLLHMGHLPHILSTEELADLHTPITRAPDAEIWFKNRFTKDFSCHYGLGFRILKHGDDVMIFHGGWLKGFASFLAFLPEKQIGIVILSNTESGFALATAMDFLSGNFN